MPRSDRDIAREALELVGTVLATFRDVGSIDGIENVVRSRWQDRRTWIGWIQDAGALTDELDPPAVPVEFCNWCTTPTAPDPRWHPNGQPNHVEPAPSIVHSGHSDGEPCTAHCRTGGRSE